MCGLVHMLANLSNIGSFVTEEKKDGYIKGFLSSDDISVSLVSSEDQFFN